MVQPRCGPIRPKELQRGKEIISECGKGQRQESILCKSGTYNGNLLKRGKVQRSDTDSRDVA